MGEWKNFDSWDQRVVEAISEGNFSDAADVLMKGYLNAIVGYCVTLLGDREMGEEVAQEVFLAAYRAMPHFRGDSSVRTWLFAIVRKQCWKQLEKNRRRKILEDKNLRTIQEFAHRDPFQPVEDTSLLRQRQLECLQESLSKLKMRERELLMMYYFEDLSLNSIAKILWVSEATVHRRLQAARQRLKAMMEEGMAEGA